MTVEPVQLIKWFPPSRCVTPVLHRLSFIPWIVLCLLAVLCAYWAYDRVEPLRVLRQDVIPKVHAGDVVLLEARVKRDLDPVCAVNVHRAFISKGGFRFPGGEYSYSQDALQAIALRSPDMLRVAIQVPYGMPLGPATVHTTLQYHCNPLDRLWPITAVTTLEFEVVL